MNSTLPFSVRSFGTEDRPTPNPVAGREDVYEYIIFKAKDIKDLIVCETPKPVVELSSGLPYDPAIITVSQNRTAGAPAQPGVGVGLTAVSGGCKFDRLLLFLWFFYLSVYLFSLLRWEQCKSMFSEFKC